MPDSLREICFYVILNFYVNYHMKAVNTKQNLDKLFEALSNKHRREIIYSLGLQPYSISRLAGKRDLSLPAIHKHIKILEDAGVVIRKKVGRINFLTLNRESLLELQNWLAQYHAYWGNNKETLNNYAKYLKGGESI
jgi:DNA-binding transcriptional ArsR family regulator